MRTSIAVKLLLTYVVLLAVCLVPGYVYLRSELRRRLLITVENDLTLRAQAVSVRLESMPDAQLKAEAQAIAALLVDRVTIFAPDGRVLGDSAPAAQHDDAAPREALHQVERHRQYWDVRTGPGGVPYLYVWRLFDDPTGKPRGVVRLARPVDDIQDAMQRAITFQHRVAGVAASLALLLVLGYLLLVVWPMRRLRDVAQAFARGEYTVRAPTHLPRDEVGDLGQVLLALGRTLVRESVRHSAESALRQELVRVLPVPLAVLDPQLGPIEINPAFREAAEVDPATEQARMHQLAALDEVRAAIAAGTTTREPQHLSVRAPWKKGPLSFTLWPLPASGGQVLWAMVLATPGREPRELHREGHGSRLLHRAREVLEEGAARCHEQQPELEQSLRARLLELRALAEAHEHAAAPTSQEPEAPLPVDLRSLLRLLLSEMQPLLHDSHVTLDAERLEQQVLVVECGARVERGLRLALCRAVAAAHPRRVAHAEEAALSLEIHREATVVHLALHGLRQPVQTADIDRLLVPVGGGANLGEPHGGALADVGPGRPEVRGHHELALVETGVAHADLAEPGDR